MASTENTRHATDPPAASGSQTFRENRLAKPGMNAVACEVQVIATGARPSKKDGERELFMEETTTAVVFENGGVLRLSAAVVPGQLLFLTHKETKREVVAQVTRKRNFQPTVFYVEVEFSEPSPGFWGVQFPKTAAQVPTNALRKAADVLGQGEEDTIGRDPSAPTPAPNAQEVLALKNEVEALREQLHLLQKQTVAGNSSAPAATPPVFGSTSPEPSRAAACVSAKAPMGSDGELSRQLPAEVSGALASVHSAAPASALPPTDTEAPFNEEDLLPKPALKFKDAKPPSKTASAPKQKVAAPSSTAAALRKDLVFAAFVIVAAGAAWYQNLLPWLAHPKSAFSSDDRHPAARMPQKAGNAQAYSSKSPQTSAATTTSPSGDSQDRTQRAPLGTAQSTAVAAGERPAEVSSAPDAAGDEAVVQEKPEVAAAITKRSAAMALSKASLVSVVPPSDEVGVVPPKLIKAVRAIASPNALQDFGGGSADNVTFDALVDTTGHVKAMEPLSGSHALQSAAMEALKQYVYEPATRHGKPVPAHVTVTVKFLFEP